MPRKGQVPKRKVLPDPKFADRQVTKFINGLLLQGKRSVAEKVFYGSLDIVEKKSGEEGVKVLKKALDNVKPGVEVKPRRVGGATYQVPMEVRPERRQALAIRWLVQAARDRGEKTMTQRLANELMDASQNRGNAVKKREDTHRMAEANKAFSHYRW
ncbi:MAG: 30S ribosomal protein S7 [Myxococcota bacterium]|nr:30S ribosomal protein S7 [Myxococcota bacterium]